MSINFRDAFSGFGAELLDSIRAEHQERLDDAALEERIIGIENATSAMLELGVDDACIIQMLQKYWDLRLSEASKFIDRQKEFFKDENN